MIWLVNIIVSHWGKMWNSYYGICDCFTKSYTDSMKSAISMKIGLPQLFLAEIYI